MENKPQTRETATGEGNVSSRRTLTRDAMVASICGFVVVLMVGASYAAVPFYDWFCRATGFNGTTQVATAAPADAPLSRKISVRFDANVGPGLPWKFEPEQNEIEVRIGEVVTVFYTVTNQAARATTGVAAYNVTPLTVGAYFQKINCFCFTEQTMGQQELGLSPLSAGLVFLPTAFFAITGNLASGPITNGYGARLAVVVGLSAMALGLVLMLVIAPLGNPVLIALCLIPIGAGGALAMPSVTGVVLEGVPGRQAGTASAVFNTFRQVGGAVAIAVFGALIANPDQVVSGLRVSLGIAAALLLLAALHSLRIQPRASSPT